MPHRVRWHTGAADGITVERIGPGRTPAAALELVRRHGATHTSEQLAGLLNAAGLVTGRGHTWTPPRNLRTLVNSVGADPTGRR